MAYNENMLIKALSQLQHWRDSRCGPHLMKRALERGFKSDLASIDAQSRDKIRSEIDRRLPEIIEDDRSWSVDVPTRGQLEWAASVLAAHEALEPHLTGPSETVDLLISITRDEWNTARNRFLSGRLPGALLRHRKRPGLPLNALLPQYGAPWHWHSIPREDGGFDVFNRDCFYDGFMTAHGMPELAGVFWSLDAMWTERITPERCGFLFEERRKGSTNGKDWCRCFSFTPATRNDPAVQTNSGAA